MTNSRQEEHPIIALFKVKAKSLNETQDKSSLDDAIALLADWIDKAADCLSNEDFSTLIEIGGIIFRYGLRQKMVW